MLSDIRFPLVPLNPGYFDVSDIKWLHATSLYFWLFAEEAIMAAEGEEGPRLGTTHPYLGPFVRYFYKQIITQERVGLLPLQYWCVMCIIRGYPICLCHLKLHQLQNFDFMNLNFSTDFSITDFLHSGLCTQLWRVRCCGSGPRLRVPELERLTFKLKLKLKDPMSFEIKLFSYDPIS